jgi:hypothetical protein
MHKALHLIPSTRRKKNKIGLGYGSSGRSTSRGPEFKPQYQKKKKKKKKKRKCI